MQHRPQISPQTAHFDSPTDDTIERPVGLARTFLPANLDIDDLALALRCLLSDDQAPRRPAPDVDRIDLPSRRVRGTYVSEARSTP